MKRNSRNYYELQHLAGKDVETMLINDFDKFKTKKIKIFLGPSILAKILIKLAKYVRCSVID